MGEEDLQKQIDKLEDNVLALMGAYGALVKSIADAGLPLKDHLPRNLAVAADQFESDHNFPEPAAVIDELRAVVSDLLLQELDGSGNN